MASDRDGQGDDQGQGNGQGNGDGRIATVIYADMERGGLGLPSRLGDPLAGRAVLRRTVGRIERLDNAQGARDAGNLQETIVFCPAAQHDAVAQLLDGTAAVVCGLNERPPVSRYLSRRKWALSSWRGGAGEATVFDEQPLNTEMVAKLAEMGVTTVVLVPAEAVVIDAELLAGQIKHHHQHGEQMRFTFSLAPPGLTGAVYRLDLVGEMAQGPAQIGDALAYNPDSPAADKINAECIYRVEPELCGSQFRYLADTQRSFAGLEQALRQIENNGKADRWAAGDVVAAMAEQLCRTDILPRELEVEINSEPSVRIEGYPHRERGSRGPMSLLQFEKIVGDCAQYDDICLTIGGFGEPLAHEQLPAMIAAAKAAGIFGINIETDGLRLAGPMAEALAQSQADVISVYVDADSRQSYQQIKGSDDFDKVVGQIAAFQEKSQAAGGPMVIPHLVKSRQTIDEMESFYDRWRKGCNCAVIVGYSDFAGQIEDQAVTNMAAPQRRACRRLNQSMTILADGSATICGQDFEGKCTVGNVFEQSVAELWRCEAMENLRQAHRDRQFDINQLCPACKEWHR